MQLDERQQEPMRRLRELAEKTNGAMEVPDIVEAVVGVDSDEGDSRTRQGCTRGQRLTDVIGGEIASGIAKLVLWRGKTASLTQSADLCPAVARISGFRCSK